MKRIIFSIILSAATIASTYAQKEIPITATSTNTFFADAPTFSFTEPVKLIVDVSGVPALVGVEPLYIWGFIDGCCGSPNNGDWGNSNEANRMTKVSENVWSFDVPSVKAFVGASYKQAKDAAVSKERKEEETRFGFLVKAKDGSGTPEKKTGDINLAFTGPVYIKARFETFPLNPAETDVVTFVYNQDIETVEEMKGVTDVYLRATPEIDDVEPKTVKMNKNGSRYTVSLIPKQFFELEEGEKLERIQVLIGSESFDVNFGTEVSVKLVSVK